MLEYLGKLLPCENPAPNRASGNQHRADAKVPVASWTGSHRGGCYYLQLQIDVATQTSPPSCVKLTPDREKMTMELVTEVPVNNLQVFEGTGTGKTLWQKELLERPKKFRGGKRVIIITGGDLESWLKKVNLTKLIGRLEKLESGRSKLVGYPVGRKGQLVPGSRKGRKPKAGPTTKRRQDAASRRLLNGLLRYLAAGSGKPNAVIECETVRGDANGALGATEERASGPPRNIPSGDNGQIAVTTESDGISMKDWESEL